MSENNNMLEDKTEQMIYSGITDVISKAYLNYAGAVISSRALPDIRDGMKPVHRRTIFAQQIMGNYSTRPYKKSARVVGDVIGKYHPHGDLSVYEALARMTQNWTMNAPLADGQGNFGSRDGDSPAAMRYTEVRMTKLAESMLTDMNEHTVKYVPNYDGTEHMPSVFPTRFPNLLVNGGEGIAVGMASSIPTHNPIEVMRCFIEMVRAELRGEKVPLATLMEIMPAPDFPSGGLIHGLEDYESAWTDGRCIFSIRSTWDEEMVGSNRAIVIKELPYAVNKVRMIERIHDAGKVDDDGFSDVDGILRVNDESTEADGVRVVVEIKSGYDPEIVFNELCKKTNVEVSFSYNMTVITQNRPKTVGIYEALEAFLEFREDIVRLRTENLLNIKKKRMHILDGYIAAINKLDETISLIRSSTSPSEANVALREYLGVDELQATKILEMRLQKLASTQLSEVTDEHNMCGFEIIELEEILADRSKLLDIIIQESEDQIESFLDYKDTHTGKKVFQSRRSEYQKELISISLEDLIPRRDCSIILSNDGFIRRVTEDDIKTQNRSTSGKKQMKFAKGDFVSQSTICNSHDVLAFVTEGGRVSFIKAYEVNEDEKGRHINNLLNIENDKVILFSSISEDSLLDAENIYLTIGTENGLIKKTKLSEYRPERRLSVFTININEELSDKVVFFSISSPNAEICLISSHSKMIRFNLSDFKAVSRKSKGVRAMSLDGGKVICGSVVEKEDVERSIIGCVSDSGILKISKLTDYRLQARAGKGVFAMKINDRTGSIVSSFIATDIEDKDIITITRKGILNRVSLSGFSITNRTTQGKRLTKVDNTVDGVITAYIVSNDHGVEEISEDGSSLIEPSSVLDTEDVILD